MTKRSVDVWFGLWLLVASTVILPLTGGCGDDDNTSSRMDAGPAGEGDSGRPNAVDGGADADAETAENGDQDGGEDASTDYDAGTGIPESLCGNGIVEEEEGEQCDDGNFTEWDGCDTLCAYSCSDVPDCDDLDVCNGQEACDADTHTCAFGEAAADGTSCGVMRSCNSGVCIDNVCGDGIEQQESEEECDDGDLDDSNGCTRDCKLSCVSTDSSRDCTGGGECAAPMACNDEEHICEASGSAPPDKVTLCDEGDGWCIQGNCVPVDCGDGAEEGGEQCDEGPDNGKPGSGCSADCKTVVCGNDIIEGAEQCDDGNTDDLDGCDSSCHVEVVFRLTRMDVLSDPPPDFCAVEGNALGNTFMPPLDMSRFLPGAPSFDILAMVNGFLEQAIRSGTTNSLSHYLNMNDPSGRTRDDDVGLAIYSGVPAQEWEAGRPVDFPFSIEPAYVTEDNQPAAIMPARLAGGGLVVTTEPTDVMVRSPMGEFIMLKAMARAVLDVDSADTPPEPPEIADSVKIPEVFGQGDPDEQPYRPRGILCGAFSMQSMAELPLPPAPCCPDPRARTEPYVPCDGGKVPPDCSSYLDFVRGGCDMYPMSFTVNGERPTGPPQPGPDGGMSMEEATNMEWECGSRQPGEFYIASMYATEPDFDGDGDGEPDSYTTVIAIEGNRAKIVGVDRD